MAHIFRMFKYEVIVIYWGYILLSFQNQLLGVLNLVKVLIYFVCLCTQAAGEPPLFLASSVFFATKDAITSARKDAGHNGYFQFNSPATSERIRMACQDQFTNMVKLSVCNSLSKLALNLI
jgi:hypothetical protein